MAKKKGRKWSNLEGQLPDEPVALTERETKIRAEADKLRGLAIDEKTGQPFVAKTMKELAEEYSVLCEEEDFESLAHKERSVKYESLERVIYSELQKVEQLSGQDSWRGAGQTFSPKFTVIPIVTDKARLIHWIKTNGHEEYLLDVKESRLKEVVLAALNTDAAAAMTPAERANLKAGEAASGQPPPGVTVFMRKGVHRTATK